MKLVIKNQQGENLSLNVQPQDTFLDIQRRLLQNGKFILDLAKLSTGSKTFSMENNVIEYFGIENKTVTDPIVNKNKTVTDPIANQNTIVTDPTVNQNQTVTQTEMDVQEDIKNESETFLSNSLDYECLTQNNWQELHESIANDLKNEFEDTEVLENSDANPEAARDIWVEGLPLCRLCAEEINDDEPFYIHEESAESGTTLADKINACLPIVVNPKDTLPKQICSECLVNLEASYHFSQCVTSAEDKLNNGLKPKSTGESLTCPLCCEGCMATLESDVENYSSDESSQSVINNNEEPEPEEENIIDQEIKEESHFTMRTVVPNMKRKRGRPRKYDKYDEDEKDWSLRNEIEPMNQKISNRGRPRGSKNKFYKPKNMNCFICHLRLKDYNEALSHTLSAHCDDVNKTFPCPLCQDTLTGEVELRNHIDTHNDAKEMVIIRCSLCEKEFHKLQEITDHWMEKHEKPLMMHFICPVCEYTDTDAVGLANHVVTKHATHDRNGLACPICLLVFALEEEIRQHFEENHIEKPERAVVCSECDVKLGSESEYMRHVIDTHCMTVVLRTPSYYSCYVCKNNFRSQYYLIKHTCNAIFSELYCKGCNKGFPTKSRFVFHLQSHQPDITEMRCHKCWLFFPDEDTFYDHIRFQHEPDDQQECFECNKTFKNAMSLQMHMKRHQSSRNHQCSKCGKKFQTAQTLREHLVSHMSVKPYQCHICGAYLSRLSRLRLHLRAHSAKTSKASMKVYKCYVCHQVFPNSEKALKHSETHADILNINLVELDVHLVFRCEFCDACFHQAAELKQHRTEKHPNTDAPNAYTCPICGAQFSTYARVTTHKLSHGINTETLIVPDEEESKEEESFIVPQYFLCHECDKKSLHYTYMSLHRRFQHASGSPIYTCNVCKQKFATSWSLQYHKKRDHNMVEEGSGVVNTVNHCKFCNKPYITETSLEMHIKRCHPGETQEDLNTSFICETCGKTFQFKTLLDAHTDAHKGWKRFECTLCARRFTHKAGLIRHMKLHSDDDPFDCEFCGKKFRDKSERENHRRAHTGERPFMCDICGRTFHTRAVWLDHSRIHEDIRPYRCDVCRQSFRRSYALKSHYLIHTGEKPFACEYCGKKFRLKQSVFAHKKKEHSRYFNDDPNESLIPDVLLIEENSQFEDDNFSQGNLSATVMDTEPDCDIQSFIDSGTNEVNSVWNTSNIEPVETAESQTVEPESDQGFRLLI